MKNKFQKETGTILHYCEIKISKPTKKVTYEHHTYEVVVSDSSKYCVQNKYGSLQLLDKIVNKYSSNSSVNKVCVYEQRWNMRSMDDYLISTCVSTFSEKVTKGRVKSALIKFIKKEAYFYHGLEHQIDIELKVLTDAG